MNLIHPDEPVRRLPPLAALRAFEAAARHESFKRAAAELGVTPTAISHQIRLLEETLGLALFERQPRRVVLTPAGRLLFPVLRDGFDGFAAAVGALSVKRRRSAVTLSATTAFTAHWLVPRVAAFNAANPGMDLRLHASDEVVDLTDSAIDAAIRYGRGGYGGLVAEELLCDSYAPVCSPRLAVRTPEDLRRHRLIHFEWRRVEDDTPTWQRWLERAGMTGLDDATALTFSDEGHAIQAAVAGHGVALLSRVLVAAELARGALVEPFGPALDGYRYFLVYPQEPKRAVKIAALRAWIHAALEESLASASAQGGERR
jgi:LysR family transcriptional regulator, glycine cleavage system transcriptional activator